MINAYLAYTGMILFIAIDLGFVVLFYVAQTKLGRIETLLNRCIWVNDTYRTWGNSGFIGKVHRISIVYSIFISPTFWEKKGIIDLEQVHSLPKNLRLWIQIPYTLMITATVTALSIYLLAPRADSN